MDSELERRREAERLGLSPRMLEVLTLIADGHSNAAIAARLFLSEETVKTYVKQLLRTLGVRNRAHAVAEGFRRGVLV